jgi:D-alanyl-D-alanine carboxypeptidase
MCHQNPEMVTDLPNFYRKLVKDNNSNSNIFDSSDLDQIADAAQADQYPIISAKKWAISNKNKGQTFHGKSQDEQCEIASMTKVCTSYTVCRILEEMEIYGIE